MDEVKILVVDDDPGIRQNTGRVLKSAGYQVSLASTGDECLQLVQEEPPDLILLDIMLPDIDGFEVCRQIKSDPNLTDIYVILISGARTSTDDLTDGVDKGADGFISRPITSQELRARVRMVVRLKQTEDALRRVHDDLELQVQARTAELALVNEQLRQEIKERRKIEEALRESQARLANILDLAHEAIISVDETQQIVRFNTGAEQVFGYAADEIIGQPLDLLLPERFWDSHRDHLVAFAQAPVSSRRMGERREISGRRKNGEEFPAEASISKLKSDDGTVFTVILRDITQRKRAEEKLREAELRYRTITEFTYDWVYWETPEGELTYISPSCERITGYPAAQFIEDPFLIHKIIIPEDKVVWTQHQHKQFPQPQSNDIQFRVRRRDGEIRWIEHVCQPVIDGQGTFLGFRASNRDISERKQAEEELRQHREHLEEMLAERAADLVEANEQLQREIAERLRTEEKLQEQDYIINLSPVVVFLWRAEEGWPVEYVSENVREFGYIPQDFYTERVLFADIVHPDDRERVAAEVVEYSQDGRSGFVQEYRLITNSGSERWVEDRTWVRRGQNNIITHYQGVVFDITERKQADRALRQAKETAEIARLEEQSRRREAERRRQIAESLGGIVSMLNRDQPLADTLDYIASQTNRLLNSDASAIYRQAEGNRRFTVLAAQGHRADEITELSICLGHSALEEAVSTRQPLAFSDMDTVLTDDVDYLESDSSEEIDLSNLARQFRALLAVPLIVNNAAYGGIVLYYREPQVFSGEEIALAVIFGDQVALALENARLKAEAEQDAVSGERNRLARDLHDAVTQTLFSVAAIAETLPRIWEHHPQEAKRGLENLRRLSLGALAEMRTLLVELRPKALVEKKMSELLRQLADAMMGRTQMIVTTTVVGERRLPDDVQIAFYRIAQESLNNVAKHARAGRVTLGLYYEADCVELRISDDGRGFDPGTILPHQLGMGIMAERAKNIGAILEIQSQPDQGTKIVVNWPDLQRRKNHE